MIAWLRALFADPPLPLPAHLQRPWTPAEVAIVALHMERAAPWLRVMKP